MYAADYIPASKITNVCLVSQDDTALAEAKRLVRGYFQKVKSDGVVQASTELVSSPEAGDDLDQNCATPGVVVSVFLRLLSLSKETSSFSCVLVARGGGEQRSLARSVATCLIFFLFCLAPDWQRQKSLMTHDTSQTYCRDEEHVGVFFLE